MLWAAFFWNAVKFLILFYLSKFTIISWGVHSSWIVIWIEILALPLCSHKTSRLFKISCKVWMLFFALNFCLHSGTCLCPLVHSWFCFLMASFFLKLFLLICSVVFGQEITTEEKTFLKVAEGLSFPEGPAYDYNGNVYFSNCQLQFQVFFESFPQFLHRKYYPSLQILVPEYGMNYWVFFSVTFLNHGFWFPARLTKTGEKFCAKYSESFRLQVGYLLASYVQQEGIRCLQTFIGTTLLFPLR